MVEYLLPVPKIEDSISVIDLNLSKKKNLRRIETAEYLNNLHRNDKPYIKLKSGKKLDDYLKSNPAALDSFIKITEKAIPEDKQIKELKEDLIKLIELGIVDMHLKTGEKGSIREVIENDKSAEIIYEEYKKTLTYLKSLK